MFWQKSYEQNGKAVYANTLEVELRSVPLTRMDLLLHCELHELKLTAKSQILDTINCYMFVLSHTKLKPVLMKKIV